MEMNKPVVIYRCRRCGKKFEKEGTYTGNCLVNGIDVSTGPVYTYHHCDDGIYGLGDLIGGYEVENEHK